MIIKNDLLGFDLLFSEHEFIAYSCTRVATVLLENCKNTNVYKDIKRFLFVSIILKIKMSPSNKLYDFIKH